MKVSVVEESFKGLYLWQTADGSIVADSDGNYLSIQSFIFFLKSLLFD